MMRWGSVLALALGLLPSSAVAQSGHELVDVAVEAYEAGEFERASEMLERALGATELTRADVVRILHHEVLVMQALGSRQLDTAMLRLVSLETDGLGASTSPQLTPVLERAVEQTRGEVIHLEIEHRDRDDRLEVRARVRGDIAGLVESVRLWTRTGETSFGDPAPGTVELDAAPEDVVVVAEAIGPGGAVLAALGTPSEPFELSPAASTQLLTTDLPAANDESGLHIGVTAGVIGVLAVAATIVAIVFATAPQNDSRVTGPAVDW